MRFHRSKIFRLFIILLCSSCNITRSGKIPAQPINNQIEFWNSLQSLCGKSFAGTIIMAPANDTVFRNKNLVMHVRSCTGKTIQIPFIAGDDRSRTWILNLLPKGIELKHDHRHKDGTKDSITLYGGITPNAGSSTLQLFPADQYTVNILPAAATNVWWIELIPGKYFTYNLRRMGTDRLFSIKFDLTQEIATPLIPWGW